MDQNGVEGEAADALYALGYWLLAHGHQDRALAAFRTMVVVAPSDERGWHGLSALHERIGDERTAIVLRQWARGASLSCIAGVQTRDGVPPEVENGRATGACEGARADIHEALEGLGIGTDGGGRCT